MGLYNLRKAIRFCIIAAIAITVIVLVMFSY